jgi:hypothetical protein
MTPLFKKLNYKKQSTIVYLNARSSFASELTAISKHAQVVDSVKGVKLIEFAIAFCTTQAEVRQAARAIAARVVGDATVWFCYPKRSSKSFTCEFNRDTGWAVLGALDFEPVRQVAIDEDWSALRFRRPEHIKTMTRVTALTKAGKARVAAKTKSTAKK